MMEICKCGGEVFPSGMSCFDDEVPFYTGLPCGGACFVRFDFVGLCWGGYCWF